MEIIVMNRPITKVALLIIIYNQNEWILQKKIFTKITFGLDLSFLNFKQSYKGHQDASSLKMSDNYLY